MNTFRYWGPSAELLNATRAMDRLFDEFFGYGGSATPEAAGNGEQSVPTYRLPVDILETDGAYQLVASVPGFSPEDVEVTFHDGVLTIAAQARPLEAEGRWVRQERPWGGFVRKLELPQQVDGDKISASFENGVLTISIPKAASAQPVRIPVGGAKQLKS